MPEPIRLRRVLAVGAHPDDCELLCGGTLARFRSHDVAVTICAIARGDKGSRDQSPDALAAVRQAEAARAASLIGAEFHCLHAGDGEIAHTTALRLHVIEIIRRTRPDLVLTHSPRDYHADHRATAQLVTDCSWFAASPAHGTESGAMAAPPALFYVDTLAGLGFQPTEYVDITASWVQKEAMLRCHSSQLGGGAQHGEPDLVGLARDVARLRGRQCGVEYAEGFRPCLKWQRVRPYRLLPE